MVSIPKIFTIPNLKKSQLVNVKNFHWQKKINPILSKFNSKKAWTVFICQLLNYCEVTNELNSRIFFRKIKMKGPIPIPASIKRNSSCIKVIKSKVFKKVRIESSMPLLFERQACYMVSRKMFL